jgi:hypothetical protein
VENVIVWTIVAAAALFTLVKLLPRRRREPKAGECSGNCSSCAFAEPGACHDGTAEKKKPADGGGHHLTVVGALVLALAAAVPGGARAADTTETFDPGAADVELYLGMDGLGVHALDRAVLGDMLLGYGVAERFSVYLATTLEANGYLAESAPELRLGAFGTPVDTETFDLDLLLEVAGADGRMRVAPGLELNLDLDTVAAPVGLYLRAALPLDGEEHDHGDGTTSFRTGHSFELNPGLRWTVAEGHEVLAEYALALIPGRDGESDAWENGGAALGYNVVLSDTIELVSQASLAPFDDRWAAGLLVGFIATLPGAAN